MRLGLLISFLLGTALLASAHSWLGCSDYRGPVDFYDDEQCFAYPRYWQTARSSFLTPQTNGYQLGGDSGYNYQPGLPCNLPMGTPWQSAYTTDYPYAVYEQGQTYCLAWPTKNHVAGTCTNQYIPDTEMTVYRTTANPTGDPTAQSTFDANPVTHNFGVHVNGVIDCLGYQRSPRFCDNTDKAMATGCIQIPSNMPTGHYVFQWYWIFNPGAPYTTCWDADVVAAGQGRGGGGLIGADTIADSLGNGGSTCKNAWAAEAANSFAIPTPGGGTVPNPPPLSSTGTAPTPPPDTSTDHIDFVTAPAQIAKKAGTTFKVTLEYFAVANRGITVDILHLDADPPVWYGTGHLLVDQTTSLAQTDLTVVVSVDLPDGNNFVLRAWMVDEATFTSWQQCGYCAAPEPWTEELDRRDRAVLVGDYQVSDSQSSSSDKEYTAGDIAGTFFGTFLIMLAIFGLIYWFVLRPKMNTTAAK